ncbi:hypothetical protein, partial [Stenotrophomonas thermophila]
RGSGLSAVPVCREVSFVAKPPIIAGFSASSTPFFKAASPEWTMLPMLLRRWARGPFVVASRLLCRTFRVRQHLRSINSFAGDGVADRVPFPRKRCVAARGRILEILQISSRLFFMVMTEAPRLQA